MSATISSMAPRTELRPGMIETWVSASITLYWRNWEICMRAILYVVVGLVVMVLAAGAFGAGYIGVQWVVAGPVVVVGLLHLAVKTFTAAPPEGDSRTRSPP